MPSQMLRSPLFGAVSPDKTTLRIMRPTRDFANLPLRLQIDSVVTAVRVGVKVTHVTLQKLLRAIPAVVGGEVIHVVRMKHVTDVGPTPSFTGASPLTGRLHPNAPHRLTERSPPSCRRKLIVSWYAGW